MKMNFLFEFVIKKSCFVENGTAFFFPWHGWLPDMRIVPITSLGFFLP